MDYPLIEKVSTSRISLGGFDFTLYSSGSEEYVSLAELRYRFYKSPVASMVPTISKVAIKLPTQNGEVRRNVLVTMAGVLCVFAKMRDQSALKDAIQKMEVSFNKSFVLSEEKYIEDDDINI